MWARSGGTHDVSVTIVRPGGTGWALAEVALARVEGGGGAHAWVSAYRYYHSDDQIFNPIAPNPEDGHSTTGWVPRLISATMTLRVRNCYAYAVPRLSNYE